MRADPSWKPNPEGWKRNFDIQKPLYIGKQKLWVRKKKEKPK